MHLIHDYKQNQAIYENMKPKNLFPFSSGRKICGILHTQGDLRFYTMEMQRVLAYFLSIPFKKKFRKIFCRFINML